MFNKNKYIMKYDNTKEFNLNFEILKLLSEGLKEFEISDDLKRRGFEPNSLSTIEKRIKMMRKEFKAKTAIHLVSKAIRKGLI